MIRMLCSPLSRVSLIVCAGVLLLGSFRQAAAQSKQEIFQKEYVQISKLYGALLARDTVLCKRLLGRIESSNASQYLISLRYMTDAVQCAYPILIQRDYSASEEFQNKFLLAEEAAPHRDKAVVRALRDAVCKEIESAVP